MGIRIRNINRDYHKLSWFGPEFDYRIIYWPVTGSNLAMISYVKADVGTVGQEHFHAGSEEFVFVLEGEGYVEEKEAGRKHTFGEGDVILIEPRTVHRVIFTKPQVVVAVQAPPDYGFLRRDDLLSKMLDEYLAKRLSYL
jgi:quercetin dioxygenase-like cupin family protein